MESPSLIYAVCQFIFNFNFDIYTNILEPINVEVEHFIRI